MIIDLDDAFWTDDYTESDSDPTNHVASFMLGFSPIADILVTNYVIESNMCSDSGLDPNFKYTAIFNGLGNTFDEMELSFESNMTEFPVPKLFPVINQSNNLNELKKSVKMFIELQWAASKLSKSDLRAKMEKEEETLRKLVEYQLNMFSTKNLLN